MTKLTKRYQKYIILLAISIVLRVLLYVIFQYYGPRIAPLPCNTKDINYPYYEGTVPSTPFIIFMNIIVIISLLIIEYYESYVQKNNITNKGKIPTFQKSTYLFVVFKIFVIFQIGYTIVFCILRICKYTIGKLRPNFMSICKPNLTDKICVNNYYNEYECTSSDKQAIIDGRLSFFSGHAAYACFFSTFLIVYMFMRTSKESKGIKFAYIITPFLIIFGVLVSISRVTDYKHHILDVIVGFVIGTAIGIFITFLLEKTIKKEEDIFTIKES